MVKLNRTSEYGLIALRHISRRHLTDPTGVTSAREIADTYGLPFEITAKTLQRLKDKGLIQSAQGARGGYMPQRGLDQVTLAEFIELMEGPQAVVPCAAAGLELEVVPRIKGDCDCAYSSKCEIQDVMSDLNRRVYSFLSSIRLAELAER